MLMTMSRIVLWYPDIWIVLFYLLGLKPQASAQPSFRVVSTRPGYLTKIIQLKSFKLRTVERLGNDQPQPALGAISTRTLIESPFAAFLNVTMTHAVPWANSSTAEELLYMCSCALPMRSHYVLTTEAEF